MSQTVLMADEEASESRDHDAAHKYSQSMLVAPPPTLADASLESTASDSSATIDYDTSLSSDDDANGDANGDAKDNANGDAKDDANMSSTIDYESSL